MSFYMLLIKVYSVQKGSLQRLVNPLSIYFISSAVTCDNARLSNVTSLKTSFTTPLFGI